MKSAKLMWITAITSFAALALPVEVAAQQTTSGTNGQITFTQGVLDFNGGAPANVFVANPDGSNVPQSKDRRSPSDFTLIAAENHSCNSRGRRL